MKRILLTVLMISGVIVARNIDETTGWEYDASTQQAFYMFANIEVDGVDVEAIDVLGAFKDGQCIGFTNAIPSSEGGYTTLPLMGLDGPVFGLIGGEVPDEILLFDTSKKQLSHFSDNKYPSNSPSNKPKLIMSVCINMGLSLFKWYIADLDLIDGKVEDPSKCLYLLVPPNKPTGFLAYKASSIVVDEKLTRSLALAK